MTCADQVGEHAHTSLRGHAEGMKEPSRKRVGRNRAKAQTEKWTHAHIRQACREGNFESCKDSCPSQSCQGDQNKGDTASIG